MTDLEYLCNLDLKLCIQTGKLTVFWIFLAIALFLAIPYILIKFIEHDLAFSETRETDGTEIDDWFAFRKTYQTPK